MTAVVVTLARNARLCPVWRAPTAVLGATLEDKGTLLVAATARQAWLPTARPADPHRWVYLLLWNRADPVAADAAVSGKASVLGRVDLEHARDLGLSAAVQVAGAGRPLGCSP